MTVSGAGIEHLLTDFSTAEGKKWGEQQKTQRAIAPSAGKGEEKKSVKGSVEYDI